MKKEVSFTYKNQEYHASVWIFEDGEYDVTECYFIDDNTGESVDVDWKEFQYKIEREIEEYLPTCADGYYGGYSNFLDGLTASWIFLLNWALNS